MLASRSNKNMSPQFFTSINFLAERDEEHTEDISVCIVKLIISVLLAQMEKLV